jgi:phenylpropionate dioxygenase-like ring-hydroxylating dioxygenase large terminal subunit
MPLLVGLSGDAAAPGTWFTHEESGIPMLVTRTADGALEAFLAICRHRGARVASGRGTGDRFRCPYHGWTYDQHGRLVGQPCGEGFEGLATADLGLRKLPIAERHGLVFVRPSGEEPIDVDAHLGGAQRELAPLGLAGYVPFARRVTRQAMNWKLVVDTFLEAYHVSNLHQSTLGPRILGTPAAWDAFGHAGRLIAVRRSVTEQRSRPEDTWNLLEHAVVLYLLFPNTILIHQIDHIEVVEAHPIGVDDTTVVFSLYTPSPVTESARRHFEANFDLLLSVSEREDFRLGAQIQRDFHVPGNDRVVYGRNEPGVAHYHRMLEAALQAAPSAR